jgi:hypothetical protein
MGFNTGLSRAMSNTSSLSAARSSSMPSNISTSPGVAGGLHSHAVIRPLPRASQLQQLNEASIAAAAAAAAAAGSSRSSGGAPMSSPTAAGARTAVRIPKVSTAGPKSSSSAEAGQELLREERQGEPRTSSAPEAPVRVSPDRVTCPGVLGPQQIPLPAVTPGGQQLPSAPRPSGGAVGRLPSGGGRALAWGAPAAQVQAQGATGQQQEEGSDPALQRPRSD